MRSQAQSQGGGEGREGASVNFYKHYIGDFQRDTGHMSLTQRGAYLCLMHHYYATEKPLPNDHTALCRIAGAIDKSERDAVRVVMGMFEAVDSGLMHKRIEAELQKAGAVADTNRGIALAREAARRAARQAQTDHEASTNRGQSVQRTCHEQSTNQTPDTNTPKQKAARERAVPPPIRPDCVSEQVWVDWLAMRKAKRAPVTATVVEDATAEAGKAGMSLDAFLRVWCGRGSQGLRAEWLRPNERHGTALEAKAAETAKWTRGTSLDRSTQQDYIDAPLAVR